jgi:hypothetical protein
MLGTSKNLSKPSLNYMLDAQKLPSQTLEALFAFWQQYAGAQKVFTLWTTLVFTDVNRSLLQCSDQTLKMEAAMSSETPLTTI